MKDLRSFIDDVEKRWPGEVRRVKKEIDPKYEVTAIVKKLEEKCLSPILYFENVKGSNYPLLCSLYGTRERLAFAIGAEAKNITEEYMAKEASPIEPRIISKGPVKEVVEVGRKMDIRELPALWAHEADAAPYVTAGIVIAKDLDSGVRNASFGRLMVVDRDTVYTHVAPGRHLHQYYTKAEERGKPLEVAVAIGLHPALALGALSSVPAEVDELGVMGSMLGEAVELLRCETVDLEVPASAEIVLEGEMPPGARGKEGPYCEFTGYATGERMRHVIKIKAMTRREDAIYHGIVAGSAEHRLLGAIPREAHLYRALKARFPSVKRVHLPISGCGRFHCYVAMDKRTKGEPLNVAMAAFGADMMLKHVFVVDDDIDIFDERQVLWALATRVQGDKDIVTVPKAFGCDIDPSAEEDGVICKTIIDATAKPFLKSFCARATVPKEVMEGIRIEDFID